MTAKQQPAPAGLTQVGGVAGVADAAAKPRPGLYQTWAKVGGGWLCVFAAPDADAAITYARSQIRHDASSAVTRVEVRALSDSGSEVIWSSE